MVDGWQGGGREYYEPHRPPVNPRQHTRVLPDQPGGRQVPPNYRPGDPYGPNRQGGPPNRPGGPPRRPGGRGQLPPRKRRWRLVRRIIAVLVVLFVVGGVVTWFYVDNSLQRVSALADYSGRPAQGSGTNWLIVGSDSRQGLTDTQAAQLHTGDASAVSGGRTDTIMLVHLPDNSTKPTMVSLLRDSLVSIPGHGQTKINAAYAYGGPSLLVQTVEGATGLRIDHYAEIGLGGFASVVDDVGGVTMCLPQADHDTFAGIDLPAGCQKLNGTNALGYVRSRHAFAASDYARTEHQRQFIGALASRDRQPLRAAQPVLVLPDAVRPAEGADRRQGRPPAEPDRPGVGVARHLRRRCRHDGGADRRYVRRLAAVEQTKATQLFDDLNTDQAVPSSLITNE